MVIVLDIEKEAAPDLFKGMEIPHVKGGHPLVLHGAGPVSYTHLDVYKRQWL